MLQVLSPAAGTNLAVSDVPDPVFSYGLVGPGVAVVPRGGLQQALAPVSGKLVKLHPHAYVIVAETGDAVLVHLGVDTVHMQGAGFRTLVSESDQVQAGDAVVEWDPDVVAATGRSTICCVVVLDCPAGRVRDHVAAGEQVSPQQVLFEVDC